MPENAVPFLPGVSLQRSDTSIKDVYQELIGINYQHCVLDSRMSAKAAQQARLLVSLAKSSMT